MLLANTLRSGRRLKGWQEGRYLFKGKVNWGSKNASLSLSCWAGRNLFALSPRLSLSPLTCCSTPIYKGQCSVNPGTFIMVESQAIWWPQWGNILRSLCHHMVGSYNHILNAPLNGSPMDIPSPPDPLLILSRIALRGGLRWTENLKDGAPRGAAKQESMGKTVLNSSINALMLVEPVACNSPCL